MPLAPYLSNPPGRSPKGEGPTLPSNRKKWWGEAWNSKGKGHLGKGHCLGGDQWGQAKYPVGAPSAAFAVASGKGARLWCGRGSGWNRGVPLAPYRSNLPGSPLRREGPASPGSNGGRVWEGEFRGGQQRALNDQGKGSGEWQPWRGKTIIRGVGEGEWEPHRAGQELLDTTSPGEATGRPPYRSTSYMNDFLLLIRFFIRKKTPFV